MQSEQRITFFHILKRDPEELWIEQLMREQEEEERKQKLEADIERATELENEAPIIVEPATVPFKAISDWDFYRLALE